ncbi:MAG: OpgC family protein [Rhodospirillales bacterium]
MGRTAGERDLRLDFFRGLALIFIFIDHIPDNKLARVTLGSWNFSDAAEVFVFISGYTAALVFGTAARRLGGGLAAMKILGRCWTLYIAHVFLFVIFMAEVSFSAERLANPMFVEEMNVDHFLKSPHIAVLNALILIFQPAFMDILPLYIVLMLGLAVLLPAIGRWPWATVGLSALLYALSQRHGFNLPAYPTGNWFFNPLAWQLLFVLGACLGHPRPQPWPAWLNARWLFWLCAAILAVCIPVRAMITVYDLLGLDLPPQTRLIWLVNAKTNLGALRVVNFLALAYMAAYLVKPAAGWLGWAPCGLVIRMGQNSLYVFCLGIFLSYLGHLILVEFSSRTVTHVAVSLAGVGIMAAVAGAMSWFRQAEAQKRRVEA